MTEWLLASSQCQCTTIMKAGWEILRCLSPRHPSTSVTAVSLHLPTMQNWLWAFEMQLCSIQAGMDEPLLALSCSENSSDLAKLISQKFGPGLYFLPQASFSPKTEAQRQGLSPAWDAEPLQMGRVRDEEEKHFPDPPGPRENLLHCCTPATPLNNFIHQLQVKLQRDCQH